MKKLILLLALFNCKYTYTFTKNKFSLKMPYQTDLWQSKGKDGNAMPYFTTTFNKELEKWNTKSWSVFIWSSVHAPNEHTISWFARNCKRITYISDNLNWCDTVEGYVNILGFNNVINRFKETELKTKNDPLFGKMSLSIINDFGENSTYVNSINEDDQKYDCIIIDGMHRNSCAKHVLKHLKPNGVIIVNNVNQKTIGVNSESTLKLFKHLEHKSFKHPKHTDWKTDYWK